MKSISNYTKNMVRTSELVRRRSGLLVDLVEVLTHFTSYQGPNHLHISDAQAVPYIMNSPRCLKSERMFIIHFLVSVLFDTIWEGYNAVKREDSNARGLLGIVDPKEHSRRRRLWDRGLNTSALKGYQPLLTNRINQFVETLRRESSSNESIDLAKWIAFFS